MSVSGSGVSSTGPAPPTDLEMIYTGGDNFLARVKALTDAREASEAALAELNLGKSARAVLDEAQEKLTAAAAALGTANKTAATLIADAQAKASALISAASDKQVQEQIKIDEMAVAHKAWLEKTKSDADTMMAKASEAQQKASETLRSANAIAAETDARRAELTKQLAAAAQAEAEFRIKTEKLSATAKSLAVALGS